MTCNGYRSRWNEISLVG